MRTFRVVIDILQCLYDVRREKSDKGWSLSSDVELEVKGHFKETFAFSDDDEITSGLFTKFVTDTLRLLRILFEMFRN